ncbi:hypothetical protein WDU94_014796 [Cyamophila willieti]
MRLRNGNFYSIFLFHHLQECSEFSDSKYNNDLVRVKRQSYSSANSGAIQDGNNFIDSIFQIPISTLTAVGSLIKNTRPIVMRTRERIQQQYAQYQQQQQSQQGSSSRPSRGSNPFSNSYRIPKNSKRRHDRIQGRDYSNY